EMEVFSTSDPAHDVLREVIAEKVALLGLVVGSEVDLGRQEEFRLKLNARLKQAGDRPVGSNRFKKLLRDVGFKESWRRTVHGYTVWKVPANALPLLAGGASPPTSPNSPATGTGGRVDWVDWVDWVDQHLEGFDLDTRPM